ncbi:MAG: DNA adenine methylase [Chloroflexota bacterium]|nr:DNA adenine methylase [Chloroflexota bacterium]
MTDLPLSTQRDLTFKHNRAVGRHGWLRLTPAYSVKLVNQILDAHPQITHVLDPFCGTGTTSLVCAERGIASTSLDINPFLIWFARVKTATHDAETLRAAFDTLQNWQRGSYPTLKTRFIPPIQHIERWWSSDTLDGLSDVHAGISAIEDQRVRDLFFVAFCQLIIETSNAAFNHQSMSFKAPASDQPLLFEINRHERFWERFCAFGQTILDSCRQPLSPTPQILHADARAIPSLTDIDGVITSPPYPNRMSYIRELRPYMYWLGFLKDAREAGELDWQAIGGTWGIATSRVSKWQPPAKSLPYASFAGIITSIAERSPTLANYVHKYFMDVWAHLTSLQGILRADALVHYVVGNSKFYDTVVPTEQIYAALLSAIGFVDVQIQPIRKRNSKKELVEFIVSARKA